MIAAAALLLLGNLCYMVFRRGNKDLERFGETLLRGQAELAGRLSQVSEQSRQEQNRISEAVNEQKMAVLKIMDEKLLAVTKSVGDGLQKSTAQTTETLHDLRERLAKMESEA